MSKKRKLTETLVAISLQSFSSSLHAHLKHSLSKLQPGLLQESQGKKKKKEKASFSLEFRKVCLSFLSFLSISKFSKCCENACSAIQWHPSLSIEQPLFLTC